MVGYGETQIERFSEATNLPVDFDLKRDLLRCAETDSLWNTSKATPHRELESLKAALPQAEGWIESGQWRDAYELLRYASEKGLPIDQQLHSELGSAILRRGTLAFSRSSESRRDGAPRLAELGDFVHFMTDHNARYPNRPGMLEDAVSVSEVFFAALADNPRAEYELLDVMHDVGWSPARKEPYIMQLLQFHPNPELVKAKLAEVFTSSQASRPSDALEKIRLGYRAGLFDVVELDEFFEQTLSGMDIGRLVTSLAGPAEEYYPEGEEPDYYWCQRPASVVEEILPNAQAREREVIGRRTNEYVIQNLEAIRGTANEFAVLRNTVDAAEELGQEIAPELIEQLLDLATFRGDTKFNPGVLGAIKTVITLNGRGHIDAERVLISFDQITERYLLDLEEPKIPGSDGSSEEWMAHLDEFIEWQSTREGGVTKFIRKFAHALNGLVQESPELLERSLSSFISPQVLLKMIDRYAEHNIEPYRHQITEERKRLVMMYKREEFREPDRWRRERKDGLPVFMPRAQHPEKGARSMIALPPLKVAAKAEALRRLREVIKADNVGSYVEWHRSFWRGEEVPFLTDF